MNRENMYANQRSLQVLKDKDGGEVHTGLSLNAGKNALKTLSPNAFKMWYFFAQNTDGFEMQIYSKKVMEDCGFGNNTYTKVWNELKDKGYVIQRDSNVEHYEFYEKPVVNNEVKKATVNNEVKKQIAITKPDDEDEEMTRYLQECEDQMQEEGHSATLDFLRSLRESKYKGL